MSGAFHLRAPRNGKPSAGMGCGSGRGVTILPTKPTHLAVLQSQEKKKHILIINKIDINPTNGTFNLVIMSINM